LFSFRKERGGIALSGINFLAVLVAAIAGWIVGAVWYSALAKSWMAALGKTKEELVGPSGKPSPVPFMVSFIALLVMAAVLALLVSRFGPVTIGQGLLVGLLAWLGFVLTSMGVNHGFTSQKPALTTIDGGHWLAVLLLQGAVIGAFGA
jgi:hypothetical protein